MTEKKLYLLQFTSIDVAKLRASPPEIMRGKVIEFHSSSTISDHVPDDVLGDSAGGVRAFVEQASVSFWA
jgi:hypothetical protein